MALWISLVRKGNFKSIDHRFLVTGHSHLTSDKNFAMIENRARSYFSQVFYPDMWIHLVEHAGKANTLLS
jgi:hypothetical protein